MLHNKKQKVVIRTYIKKMITNINTSRALAFDKKQIRVQPGHQLNDSLFCSVDVRCGISILLRSEHSNKNIGAAASFRHQDGNKNKIPQQLIEVGEMIGTVNILLSRGFWQQTHQIIDHEPAIARKELG